MKKFNLKIFSLIISLFMFLINPLHSAETEDPIKVNWSFKGLTGKFDRASLQRGFQVYKEVCSSCHSMQYLSYRNLGEPGGPEFSEQEVKAIAASIEIEDGPDSQGEMFTRPGRPSDKFKSPYPNVNASTAANGGAYPPDMSVLVKARPGGSNYIYSVLVGYDDPPQGMVLDDGV
jgi:ubiquinol-cytochrome c reductase cytochrome c1 subunit